MDKDATPSFVGYCVQEVLVARYFAFLHVLTIFFGLYVDSGRWLGNAAAVVSQCATPRARPVCARVVQLTAKKSMLSEVK